MLRTLSICKEQGITLQQLADRLGITYQALHISTKGNPTLETMTRIATALNITVSELLEKPSDGNLNCPHCGKKIHINTM